MAYPDLNPTLPPTVRTPQCGHTVWGKRYLVWGVRFLISTFWPNHVRTENPFKPWGRNCKHQDTQVWNRRHGLCPLRNFLKYIETSGQCQNGKPTYRTRSRGTNGEQGLKSFFRERHQFGPVHLHSAPPQNYRKLHRAPRVTHPGLDSYPSPLFFMCLARSFILLRACGPFQRSQDTGTDQSCLFIFLSDFSSVSVPEQN